MWRGVSYPTVAVFQTVPPRSRILHLCSPSSVAIIPAQPTSPPRHSRSRTNYIFALRLARRLLTVVFKFSLLI